jgi:hypothetical protein
MEGANDGKPSALEGRASPVSQDDDYAPITTLYDTFRDGVFQYGDSRPEPSTALNSGASPESPYHTFRDETSNDRTVILKESAPSEGRLTPWSEVRARQPVASCPKLPI